MHVKFSKRGPLLKRDAAQQEENERGNIFQPKDETNAPDVSTTEPTTVTQLSNMESSTGSTTGSASPDFEYQGQNYQHPLKLAQHRLHLPNINQPHQE